MAPPSAPGTRLEKDRPAIAARLSVREVAIERGGRTVLDSVGFELLPGEVLGILGPNGAGKTSLFQILCGVLPPDSGEIRLDGERISPGARSFRARCGVVFQEPALDPRLSARTNLRLAAALYGMGRRRTRERIDELLTSVGLSDRADEPVKRLSGGMRRRVELVRSLLHEPEMLVLDEPTTGLDEAALRRIWSDLLALRDERGLSVLLTTHRADEAERCDRIAILAGGGIVALDTPEKLRARVHGDVITVDAGDPKATLTTLVDRLDVDGRLIDGRIVIVRERAHEWVPRIVEALPPGSLSSVSVRRVGLGEVFIALTGHTLDVADEGHAS